MFTTEHTEDCQGGDECEPVTGVWNQPRGAYVSEAQWQLGDDVPWCRIHELAWQLQDDEDAE